MENKTPNANKKKKSKKIGITVPPVKFYKKKKKIIH